MAGDPVHTRDRIVRATAELFGRRGYHGVGLKEVARESGSPIGSMYHFFPGGKNDLAAEALRRAGREYQAVVAEALIDTGDLVTGLRAVFDKAAAVLEASGYADACPIETVALEVANSNEALRQVCADIFAEWTDAAAAFAAMKGVPEEHTRALALGFLALLEGAFVLSRTLRSTEPMAAARDAAVAVAMAVIDADAPSPRRS